MLQPSEKDRADKGCAANTESQKRLATSINEERLPDSPNVSHKGRRDSAPNHFDEEKVCLEVQRDFVRNVASKIILKENKFIAVRDGWDQPDSAGNSQAG